MRPDEDWEIDHDEPWRITHRTNIFELQAVHRKCNNEKGGKVDFEIRFPEELRPGQKRAIDLIQQRVVRGEATTAIVLPCRYGKSDVIRLASLGVWARGEAVTSLGLSPGENLRQQLGDITRWQTVINRYGVRMKAEPQIAIIDKPKAGLLCRFNPNSEAFLSATIQLVQNNLGLFEEWVDAERRRTGLPVLVFIDECHTNSEENEWGRIVPTLTDAGAHVVLLTATPERADKGRIPGFDFDEIEEEPYTLYRTRPHQENPDLVRVEKLEGWKSKMRLKPDLEVSFKEAWQEAPPILCKISRITFDVELKQAGEEATWLSEIDSPSKVRQYLGKIVRDEQAIEKGCRMMLKSLMRRRALRSEFQAIIYCGNDIETGSEREDNKHPKQVQKIVRKIAQEFNFDPDIRIATSAAGGKEIIESFAGRDDAPGRGDILIVKQMAGMGLDLPWVKTGLDLSATRTYPGLVQRQFRPATPCADAVTCDWITPDDVISAVYFNRLVTDQGGEATATGMTVVDSYDKERQEGGDSSLFTIDDVRTGRFDDSVGNVAQPETWERVTQLLDRFPRLQNVYTHAELVAMVDVVEPLAAEADEHEVTVQSSSASAASLRAEINKLIADSTQIYQAQNNLPYSDYGNSRRKLMGDAKKFADWPRGVKLDASDDVDALHRVKMVAQRIFDGLTG
jgi:hypothetical protein